MKKLVVFTGAGMSAESGFNTFRDKGGLWEQHRIEDVATPDGWNRNPEFVLNFYNNLRKQLINSEPNQAHQLLAELENKFDVEIITQNVDNLHERAGSTKVLHLHGELMKVRSSIDKNLLYDTNEKLETKIGDKCELGSQLRPHIVFFGEDVPNMPEAIRIAETADIFCVIGTSLAVYPAASLMYYVPKQAKIFLIDPNPPIDLASNIYVIPDKATTGVEKFVEIIE